MIISSKISSNLYEITNGKINLNITFQTYLKISSENISWKADMFKIDDTI